MKENKFFNKQTFFKSLINNKVLFERRKNSILFPIIILVLIVSLLSVPTFFMSRSVNADSLMKNFPKIEKPVETILTSDLDCVVKNGTFSCSEETPSLNMVVGDDIKYTVIVNQKTIALDTTIVYNTPKDTDNLIVLFSQTIRIRYSQRNHVDEKVDVYEIIGDYSSFEGLNLREIGNKIANNPDSISKEVKNFIVTAYRSTLDTQLLVNISSSLVSYLLLVFVTCIILKGTFKLKKGFKIIDCFKISLTSALSPLLITLFLSLFLGYGVFATIFGFLFVGRILFIYFKYIFIKSIFTELYAETKEERYNF